MASTTLFLAQSSGTLAEKASSAMTPEALALTITAALGAVGLALLLQPGRAGMRIAGTIVLVASFAMLCVEVVKRAASADGSTATVASVFPIVFGFIALVGAVRMVTHPRPVFAALYFILVVIATGGMFLLLGAEFMAFSLVIVYAGAILITYMFVLMLAQQSPVAGLGDAWYDRVPRESISAVLVGFVMLAVLGDAYFSQKGQAFLADRRDATLEMGRETEWARLDSMPKLLMETVQVAYADAWKKSGAEGAMPKIVEILREKDGRALKMESEGAVALVQIEGGKVTPVALANARLPDNSRQVGVDLVSRFPAGLEIAGVVLLMALFGAVILARKQIELGEDERRSLAGMRRLSVDGEPGTGGAA